MSDTEFTAHVCDMIAERRIAESWLREALQSPDRKFVGDDGNVHYLKAIHEFGGRYLRVIVNDRLEPSRIVTVFFDRRVGKTK